MEKYKIDVLKNGLIVGIATYFPLILLALYMSQSSVTDKESIFYFLLIIVTISIIFGILICFLYAQKNNWLKFLYYVVLLIHIVIAFFVYGLFFIAFVLSLMRG